VAVTILKYLPVIYQIFFAKKFPHLRTRCKWDVLGALDKQIVKMCDDCGVDGKTLLAILKKFSQSVALSGGFLLACLLGEEKFNSLDIDFLIHPVFRQLGGVNPFEKAIFDQYQLNSWGPAIDVYGKDITNFEIIGTSTYIQQICTELPEVLKPVYQGEYFYTHNQAQVHWLEHAVKEFDFDFVKNYYDGQTLYIRHLPSILYRTTRLDILEQYVDTRYHLRYRDRVRKYQERGFTITPNVLSPLDIENYFVHCMLPNDDESEREKYARKWISKIYNPITKYHEDLFLNDYAKFYMTVVNQRYVTITRAYGPPIKGKITKIKKDFHELQIGETVFDLYWFRDGPRKAKNRPTIMWPGNYTNPRRFFIHIVENKQYPVPEELKFLLNVKLE